MSALKNISSHLTREELATMQLRFHQNNQSKRIDITKKTDEEIARLFFSEDFFLNQFAHDFGVIKTVLEQKWLECTHVSRLALAKELWLSDYVVARIENVSWNKDIAAEYYQKAVDNDGEQKHPDMIIEYANFLAEMWKYDKALAIYTIVIDGPAKEWALLAQNKLWNLYYTTKKYKEAEECYSQATTSENIATRQEAHANLAALYKQVMEWRIQL